MEQLRVYNSLGQEIAIKYHFDESNNVFIEKPLNNQMLIVRLQMNGENYALKWLLE